MSAGGHDEQLDRGEKIDYGEQLKYGESRWIWAGRVTIGCNFSPVTYTNFTAVSQHHDSDMEENTISLVGFYFNIYDDPSTPREIPTTLRVRFNTYSPTVRTTVRAGAANKWL